MEELTAMAIVVGSIEEAVEDMKRRGRAALRSAVNKAAQVASEDIYQFSISCIDQYYASYAPSIYDRTNQLYQTSEQVSEVSEGGDMISAKVGVKFNASAMGTHQHSTFWGTRAGIATGYNDEILSNFLDGIHPRTNGSPLPGAPYIPAGGPSADSALKAYLSAYMPKMEQFISSYFSLSI